MSSKISQESEYLLEVGAMYLGVVHPLSSGPLCLEVPRMQTETVGSEPFLSQLTPRLSAHSVVKRIELLREHERAAAPMPGETAPFVL